jgi:hypothetical protein
VLEGELTLLVEDVEHMLGPDRLVPVEPAARRQLTNAGAERLVLLALAPSCGPLRCLGVMRRAWEPCWGSSKPGDASRSVLSGATPRSVGRAPGPGRSRRAPQPLVAST